MIGKEINIVSPRRSVVIQVPYYSQSVTVDKILDWCRTFFIPLTDEYTSS